MGYLRQDEDNDFFDPRKAIQSPLPSMRFKPRNAEEAIIALQVYMDVFTLLRLEDGDEFDGELFNIEDVRRRIYDFRNNVEETRQSWLDQRDELTNTAEELRLANLEIDGNKSKIRLLQEDLEDAQGQIDHLNNVARLQNAANTADVLEGFFNPKERPIRDH